MKKQRFTLCLLALTLAFLPGVAGAAITAVTGVTVNNVPGTPPQYNLLTITVGSYTVPLDRLAAGTSTGTANSGGATYGVITNMDSFDLNLFAARDAVPAPNNTIDTVLFGGKNYYNTNGSQPDFFLFEAASGSNPDDVGVAAIFPDGSVGTAIDLPTAAPGWGATGLLISATSNNGQPIMGVCFDITDLKNAAGVNLSSSAVIKGIRIMNGPVNTAPGSLDPCLFCAVVGSPAIYIEPANNSVGITSPVTFKWESSYQGAGKVLSYTLNMDDTQANVETPIAGNLIYNQVVTVGGSTPPPYAAEYTYNNALANDQDYFWRVDTVVGEPNYNVPDPNFPLYNLTNTFAGSVWKFTGPVTIPRLTGPSDVTIQPDPLTHVFTNTTAVFTADILCSVAITNVQWFKEGNATPLANVAPYTIAWNQTQTTLTVTGVTTADNGKYYCKVFTAGTSSESRHASLYCQYILKHRYSFTSDCSDSVGTAHGTIVDPLLPNITVTGGQLVFAASNSQHDAVSGDPNAHFVDLPNGLISSQANNATFIAWYTRDALADYSRLFDFGISEGGEGISSTAGTTTYIAMIPKTNAATPTMQFETHLLPNINVTTAASAIGVQVCNAVSWDSTNNTISLYVDGTLVGTGAIPSGKKLSDIIDLNNWLGRSQYANDPLFIGKINELRIYDVALSPAWIKESYVKGPDSLNLDPCILPSVYDANGDCIVNITDLAAFLTEWLSCGFLVCP